MNQLNDPMPTPTSAQASDGGSPDGRNITLIGISSGVAAGRRLHVKGNAQVEWWTLFTTLDQFDACLTTGPLRFGDPILFAQVRRELEHVFNPSTPRDVNSGARAGNELRRASP